MIEPRLSALVYGPSGAGKSWLGATVPEPRLIIDLEGRAPFTPNGRGATHWDGISPPLELARSATRTAIVTITTAAQLDAVYQWLRSGEHPFVGVTIDSLMFAQMRGRVEINSGPAFTTQDWGVLLWKMERLVQGYHDLTLLPKTKVRCVVFIAGAKTDNGFQVPMMQGQIGAKLPYLVDVAAYLDTARDSDGELFRQLFVEPYPANGIRDVKDGTDIIRSTFGGVIRDPNFTAMFEALRGEKEGE